MELNIKELVNKSPLSQESQKIILDSYNQLKAYINEIDDEELIEILEDEGLLGEIEYLIKSITEDTLGGELFKDIFSTSKKSKQFAISSTSKNTIDLLSFRLGNDELTLYGFTNEGEETFLGSSEIEACGQISNSEASDNDDGIDLIEYMQEKIILWLNISLKETLEKDLNKQNLSEYLSNWNTNYPLPVYYCEDWEDFSYNEGDLLTTLK